MPKDAPLLPNELIAHILSFLEPPKLWEIYEFQGPLQEIVDTRGFWRHVAQQQGVTFPSNEILDRGHFSCVDYKNICIHNPFGQNLVKDFNHSAKRLHSQWRVLKNGGDGHLVECPPAGADDVPAEVDSKNICVASSFYELILEQSFALRELGISEKALDCVKPTISASDWVAFRYDCGGHYKLVLILEDDDGRVVGKHSTKWEEIETTRRTWHQVQVAVSDYPSEVRRVRIQRIAQDNQFWAGHYGPKMAGAALRFLLPDV